MYQCATCGQWHDELPDVGFQWPDHYFDVPEAERSHRVVGNSQTCQIDETYYFIRGLILIPVLGTDRDFGVGVWVSLKPENFDRYLNCPTTAKVGPFFGWLCNQIPFYQTETQLLKTRVHFQDSQSRPLIELAPCEHQLFRDYTQGITVDQAFAYVHTMQ